MARGLKTGERRKGTPNKATVEVKTACAQLVDDPRYRTTLATRLRAGRLAPAIECMLWHYAKGQPVERVELKDTSNLSNLTDSELRARLAELLAKP
jgi:hypothetical protein